MRVPQNSTPSGEISQPSLRWDRSLVKSSARPFDKLLRRISWPLKVFRYFNDKMEYETPWEQEESPARHFEKWRTSWRWGQKLRSRFDALKIGAGRGDTRENKWGGSKKSTNVRGYGTGRIPDREAHSWGKHEVDDGTHRKFKGVRGKCTSMGHFHILDIGLEQ